MKSITLKLGLAVFFAMTMLFTSCVSLDGEEIVENTAADENQLINSWIEEMTSRDYDVDTTYMGVYYLMQEESDGAFVQDGDSIGIEYVAYFLDGGVFDSSEYLDDGVYRYVHSMENVSSGDLIVGLYDAANQLQVGAKGAFLMRSSLAYGTAGNNYFPAYTPVIFNVKLIEIY